jgi:hypothetical protein
MCQGHRRRFRKHGDPLLNGHDLKVVAAEDRFWAKVYPCPWTGCWHWGAATVKRGGYGRFNVGGGRIRLAHIVSYELLIGPVPEGLVLDHVCRVTCCVNPDHLEPVTAGMNTLRGFSPGVVAWRTDRCVAGLHEFTAGNTYVRPDTGARSCRACTAIRESRRTEARRRTCQSRHLP